MSLLPTDAMLLGRTAIFIMAFSFLYRRNIFYDILQGLLIAGFCSVELVASLQTIYKSSIVAVQLGQFQYIIAIIWGLLYLAILAPQLRYVYRIVAATTLAVTIGVNEPQVINAVYVNTVGYGRRALESPSSFLVLILYLCAILYFIFAKKFETTLKIPRLIGAYTIYTFAALMMPPDFYWFVDKLTTFIGSIAFSVPSLILLLVALGAMLVDAQLRRMKAVEVPTTK